MDLHQTLMLAYFGFASNWYYECCSYCDINVSVIYICMYFDIIIYMKTHKSKENSKNKCLSIYCPTLDLILYWVFLKMCHDFFNLAEVKLYVLITFSFESVISWIRIYIHMLQGPVLYFSLIMYFTGSFNIYYY